MDTIPDILTEDVRYCVLDYSAPKEDVDFFFCPLIYLDIFPRPAAVLKVGKYSVKVPLDWSIIIADKNLGMIEILDLKHINDRDFTAFVMNPITSFIPEFMEISIDNIFNDITWTMPRLKFGHILAIPLTKEPNAPCIFCVKETNKIPDSLDIGKIIS